MAIVKITKNDFDSLSDERLSWTCMEPTFRRIRGKNATIKSQAISELTEGQQALCMFRVMYDHAINSAAEYYCWMSYLLDQSGYWSGVMNGLNFFGDRSMIRLLEETKETFQARNLELGLTWGDAALRHLDEDKELLNVTGHLFERFQAVSTDSLKSISSYIRSHPEQFVLIDNR
ncbi:hypothetical protein [Cohnella herbarum]|uniref:DUF4375 domain-containing protein n=1 Tax=Cohnella herbarum TaxID=2728023 RepID=A0A7Z2ZL36_9BACL|nr:hypothetical protein [Cohnella herbarum]QJD83480.1 hypothetical protein HH215_09995 [Cohnella herbarum]